MQGVIKSYDPGTAEGVVMRDLDRSEYDLSPDALEGSVFRMLRQGQRVVFDLDADGRIVAVEILDASQHLAGGTDLNALIAA